ncbi:MAG: hypothetical protein WD512_10480, partial [Candidatus Paceibacterota bacterium]
MKAIKPNRIDAVKDRYFKEYLQKNNIQVIESEKHLFHLLVEYRLFRKNNGAKVSKISFKKMTPEALKQVESRNHFLGAIVSIIHDPTLKSEVKPIDVKKVESTDGSDQDENPEQSGDEKSSIEMRVETLNEETNDSLKAILNELTGEPIKGNPKKEVLVESIILAEYQKAYVERFETEPSDDMTA